MKDPLRHHREHADLHGAFGNDAYGRFAERTARSLGTPQFLIGQTCFLIIWIALNGVVLHKGTAWDLYPFILLNLMLSFQAAYSAPFILVAGNRQAQRDQATEEADAKHRQEEFNRLSALMDENTRLTELVHQLSERMTKLTEEVHDHVVSEATPPTARKTTKKKGSK